MAQCSCRIFDGYMEWDNCSKKPVVMLDDKWYCKKHAQEKFDNLIESVAELRKSICDVRRQIRTLTNSGNVLVHKVRV